MKNIHLIPTDKPSRLFYDISLDKIVLASTSEISKWFDNKAIYITSDEEIKVGDWVLQTTYEGIFKCSDAKIEYIYFDGDSYEPVAYCKKIILTTDQDLIHKTCVHNFVHIINDGFQCTKCKKHVLRSKITVSDTTNGVQAIDDEFLEWFVKNPSCEEVKIEKICNNCGDINCIHAICSSQISKNKGVIYKIIIPKESQCTCERYNDNTCNYCENKQSKEILESAKINANKQETLEEATKNWITENSGIKLLLTPDFVRESFKSGAKWQAEKSFTLEQIDELFIGDKTRGYFDEFLDYRLGLACSQGSNNVSFKEWFSEFKKK